MLYTSAGQILILLLNNIHMKFIWKLLRMFITQILEKSDCKMKNYFIGNISKKHVWLIAMDISNEMSTLAPQRARSTFSHTQPFVWHTRKLGKTHTHHFLGLKRISLWILMVLHFRFWIPTVSLQHGFFYTVTDREGYTFFNGSQ